MIIIGLTGSIATGKSTVASLFKQLGAYIIDWDVLARDVQSPHRKAWEEIMRYFGKEMLYDYIVIYNKITTQMKYIDEYTAESILNSLAKEARAKQLLKMFEGDVNNLYKLVTTHKDYDKVGSDKKQNAYSFISKIIKKSPILEFSEKSPYGKLVVDEVIDIILNNQ